MSHFQITEADLMQTGQWPVRPEANQFILVERCPARPHTPLLEGSTDFAQGANSLVPYSAGAWLP